jgi:hypothetical protein
MSYEDFIGTWKLVSFELRRGNMVSFPYGEDAIGFIMYNPDGYMAAFLSPKERKKFESDDTTGGSVEEKVAAADTFFSYCGRFEVLSDMIVHHVETSFYPNWVGDKQERLYRFEGDYLILSTPSMLAWGEMQSAHLTWKRVKSNQ